MGVLVARSGRTRQQVVKYAAAPKRQMDLRPCLERIALATRRARARIAAPKAPGHAEAGAKALVQLERARTAARVADTRNAVEFLQDAEHILRATNRV